ncbi:hypothetical protein QR685DRAFT_170810 [Neurospora intermedia]|uniref:Uncharacterized protein n=1 Tax=Neurospora intermedia TaxID=5142 RepID=A0ABR3DKW4_NEUIN
MACGVYSDWRDTAPKEGDQLCNSQYSSVIQLDHSVDLPTPTPDLVLIGTTLLSLTQPCHLPLYCVHVTISPSSITQSSALGPESGCGSRKAEWPWHGPETDSFGCWPAACAPKRRAEYAKGRVFGSSGRGRVHTSTASSSRCTAGRRFISFLLC